jgi:hypothetical protein
MKTLQRTIATLALLAAAFALATPAPGAAPAKGTEILWDRFGIPHMFAPDHASLFYAYGYAQMEAHSELLIRLYAQARGRGAELYGEEYLESDRWVRTNGLPERAKQWAAQQSPEFAPLLAAFARRAECLVQGASRFPERSGQSGSSPHGGRCPGTWSAGDSLRLAGQPKDSRHAGKARGGGGSRLERMGDRAFPFGQWPCHADEQLAPGMGRPAYVLRSPTDSSGRDLLWSRLGGFSRSPAVFHGLPGLDADHQ